MPTYEYACRACGHEWEQSQRITEDPIQVCPKCAATAAHRLISAGTNFILKGGGWYSDLYATPKAAKSGEEKPSADKSESKPSGDTKAEGSGAASSTDATSKPAAKAGAAEGGKPSTTPSSAPSTPST
jgi:putative FmdB family regulatory protein